jgi:hypothetical protein
MKKILYTYNQFIIAQKLDVVYELTVKSAALAIIPKQQNSRRQIYGC